MVIVVYVCNSLSVLFIGGDLNSSVNCRWKYFFFCIGFKLK